MTLKVGLIGAGGFGTIHLLGYVRNPNCELVAIASRTKEHARNAAERFGIPKIYGGVDSWKRMIENEELDVISICTPNYLHALTVMKAIDKNLHILCEKPIAISHKELNEIESKLKNKKLIFFTSFQKRYNPIFPLIKKVIDERVLGKIILVRYYFSHYGPYKSWKPLSKEKWFFDSEKAGGGVLLDLGVHCIDILQYLIGEYDKVNGINYNTSCINMSDEDNCNVLFRFKNDELGLISVSWCNEPSETIEVFGSKGYLKIDLGKKYSVSYGPRTIKGNELIKKIKKIKNYKRPIDIAQYRLIDHFINCIAENKQESPNFEDGKRAVEFVLEAYSLKE